LPPFHFDAPIVSLAKHLPSLSEIPTSPASIQEHFSAISTHFFVHSQPHHPAKTVKFRKISPFSGHFSDILQKISKKFFRTNLKIEKVGTALA